jgi:predicted component of type VI protein secretion system
VRALYLFHESRRAFIQLRDGLVLGRARGDLNFDEDPLVSRTHCRILIEGDVQYIEDLGSRNRTRVNHVTIEPRTRRRLHLNDVIKIGRQRLILTHQNQSTPVGNVDPTRETLRPELEVRLPHLPELEPVVEPEAPAAPEPAQTRPTLEMEHTRIRPVLLEAPPIQGTHTQSMRRIVREPAPRKRAPRAAGRAGGWIIRFAVALAALAAGWWLSS